MIKKYNNLFPLMILYLIKTFLNYMSDFILFCIDTIIINYTTNKIIEKIYFIFKSLSKNISKRARK